MEATGWRCGDVEKKRCGEEELEAAEYSDYFRARVFLVKYYIYIINHNI